MGIFPNEESITRLIGAVLMEANDEWPLQHRYMQIEGMTELAAPFRSLDAQRKAVEDYLNGGSWKSVGEVVEIESGKRNDRPKLAEALRLCGFTARP